MSLGGAPASRILAICSATKTASVALIEHGEVAFECAALTARHQSESLLPLVDQVLRERGLAVTDLEGYGVSIGPGSFTSLRIGLATLKGLTFGTQIPVAPVSTLWALAAASGLSVVPPEAPLIAMLNAQRGEVYAAAYRQTPAGVVADPELLQELVYSGEELVEILPRDCLLVGGGLEVVAETLVDRLGPGIQIAQRPSEPSAGVVGRLAARVLAGGGGVASADLAPRYVRRAEAEVTRTAERFEAPTR